jgi:hypothetical protein
VQVTLATVPAVPADKLEGDGGSVDRRAADGYAVADDDLSGDRLATERISEVEREILGGCGSLAGQMIIRPSSLS